MRHRNFALRLVVQGGLLMALSVSVFMGSPGDKKNKQNNLRYEHITVQRPPASVPPVVAPPTTYAEMLGKGYARIGEVSYFNQGQHGPSEDQAKKELLEYASSKGADVAWVSTSKKEDMGEAYVPGRYPTYIDSAGDLRTSPTMTAPSFRKRKYTTTQGHAVLFVRDPELAARQLEEGKKRWARRVADIPLMRAPVFANLDTIQNIVSSMDPSLFKYDYGKSDLLKEIQTAREELKSGKHWEFSETGGGWVSLASKLEDVQGPTRSLFSGLGYYSDSYFKDPKGPQQSELAKLGSNTYRYMHDNWAIIGDFTTPNLPEHILFE